NSAEKIWAFIRENIIDKRKSGEWFSEVSPSGEPDTAKNICDLWKCPYHNGRMCMEIMKRL
ncbi:MAG: N-acylglucosamine 2-epimerase, partial [Oscillospiraceae bacterium]